MRRKEETLRRQEKQTHSEAAEEERSEGRNEPLSDWNAIVADDVSVFPRPGSARARLFPTLDFGEVLLSEEGLAEGGVLPEASSPSLAIKPSSNYQHYNNSFF